MSDTKDGSVPALVPKVPGVGSAKGAERMDCERLESVLLRLPEILADLDPEQLVAGLTEVAVELTEAQFGVFCDAEGESSKIVVASADDTLAEAPDLYRAPLLAASLRDAHSLRVDDVSQWALSEDSSRAYGSFVDGRMVRSYLASPVGRDGGPLMGTLFVGHRQPRAFDQRAERLLAGVSDHLAVALERAGMVHERALVAQALQETLLPPLLPSIPGVDLAARYRATGAGNLVGGDFYDVFELEQGSWAVVLGDVSGFGPEAAAFTGVARYTVRAVAPSEEPVEVLRVLNSELCRRDDDDRFCTAVYVRLRPGPGGLDLDVATGGHPPALVLRDDGSVERLDHIKGMALGLFPEAELAQASIHLGPGDALVLYTDGVIEARSPDGTQFGQERLERVLASSSGRTADGIARRVDLAATDFSDGETLDDLAVVVIRATGRRLG